MTDGPTSLSNLHDIVLPTRVSWWPPAPGWWVLLAIVLAAAGWLAWKTWRKWQANAYRREALQLLDGEMTSSEVAAVMRRTALAFAPRSEIAVLSSHQWVDWLDAKAPKPMPEEVRGLFIEYLYRPGDDGAANAGLKQYAKYWVTHHKAH